MGLRDLLTAPFLPKNYGQRDSWPQITWDEYSKLVFNGNTYLTGGMQQTIKGHVEDIDGSFAGLVQGAYKSNAIVFACMEARKQLFTEARFQFQQMRDGRPGKLYGDRRLGILETPWPNGNTGDLLARAIQDADLAGNFFAARRGPNLRRLRPDWVSIVLGSEKDPDVEAGDIDAEVVGYIYYPGGRQSGRDPEVLLREQVAHFAPIPDPLAAFRGMSWLLPVLREIAGDKAMTEHKNLYLANGGTPNMVISLDKESRAAESPAAFKEWIEHFKRLNPTNGFEKFQTMYLAGGTTMELVGSNFEQMDYKVVQGAGETRIAAAAGVPPVIVGLSEGLQAATYSNYGQARRRFADNTMRPLWRNMAGSLEDLVPAPSGSRLWYDDRDIQALAEDKKDLAEVRALEAQQIRTLVDGGFTPESIVDAVTTSDFTRLVHTNLFSVQLQPPGTKEPEPEPVVADPKRDALLVEALRAMARPVNVTVEPTTITVEPTNVTIAEGAFRSDIHLPEPESSATELVYDDEGRITRIVEG